MLSCHCQCLELQKNASHSVHKFSRPFGSEISCISQYVVKSIWQPCTRYMSSYCACVFVSLWALLPTDRPTGHGLHFLTNISLASISRMANGVPTANQLFCTTYHFAVTRLWSHPPKVLLCGNYYSIGGVVQKKLIRGGHTIGPSANRWKAYVSQKM